MKKLSILCQAACLIACALLLSGCEQSLQSLHQQMSSLLVNYIINSMKNFIAIGALIVGLLIIQRGITNYALSYNAGRLIESLYGLFIVIAAVIIAFVFDASIVTNLLGVPTQQPPQK
jgi:heme/copper-type cytochrome/quinol oxidase subunit 2